MQGKKSTELKSKLICPQTGQILDCMDVIRSLRLWLHIGEQDSNCNNSKIYKNMPACYIECKETVMRNAFLVLIKQLQSFSLTWPHSWKLPTLTGQLKGHANNKKKNKKKYMGRKKKNYKRYSFIKTNKFALQ